MGLLTNLESERPLMVYLDPLTAANSENQILIITKEVWFHGPTGLFEHVGRTQTQVMAIQKLGT